MATKPALEIPTTATGDTDAPETEEIVRYTLELPLSLHHALSLRALTQRTSKAAIIRQLLQDFLQSSEA